jgi:hypothetical protein
MFLKVPNDNRYELKFVSYDIHYHKILNWIKMHKFNFNKEHHSRLVNNIYFDSISYDSFKDNIYGSSSRTKVRYRWYDKFSLLKPGKLEIKYKRNIFGWKKRFSVNDLKIAKEKSWKEVIAHLRQKLPKEGNIYLNKNSVPTIINQYFRDYFLSYDRKFRVTIDRNHDVFDQRSHHFINILKKTLTQPLIVVEFKFNRENRDQVEGLTSNIPLRVSRNSKYVNSIRAVSGV